MASRLPSTHTQLEVVTPHNLERLKRESGEFRKHIRGESIGGLG